MFVNPKIWWMGILELNNMNIACLMKWLQKFSQSCDFTWCKLVKSLYYHNKAFRDISKCTPRSFHFWKGILNTLYIFFRQY